MQRDVEQFPHATEPKCNDVRGNEMYHSGMQLIHLWMGVYVWTYVWTCVCVGVHPHDVHNALC